MSPVCCDAYCEGVLNSLVVFLSYGPVWLVLFLSLSLYANDYKFCWLLLVAPHDTGIGFDAHIAIPNRYLGLCMMIISATLKANWVGAWLQILVTSRFRDRHWTPPKNASRKRIMQADPSVWENAMPGGRLVYVEGRRPRQCPKGCLFDLSDRAYHCSRMGRCLPVYDHYCAYLQATVYLRTLKPYCFILFFLPLDALYNFVVSLVALSKPDTRWTAPFVGSIVSFSIFVLVVLMKNSPEKLYYLVWKNRIYPEVKNESWTLAFKYRERQVWCLRLRTFDKNPWDLGPKENFRQVFGQHWWMWLFFWWPPEYVSRYGNYVDRDLPFADFVMTEFTNEIMPRLTSVEIDPPAPSAIHGEGPSRRQLAHSDAERRVQQGDASTSHVDVLTQHQRGARRRTQG